MIHKSVSYTDKDGYTVTIEPYDVPHEMNYNDNITIDHDNHGRAGLMYITAPNGERGRPTYWMDFPEIDYRINGINFWDDYQNQRKMGTWWKAKWYKLPIKTRMELEVKQQATKYASLKDQFYLKTESLQLLKTLIKEIYITM